MPLVDRVANVAERYKVIRCCDMIPGMCTVVIYLVHSKIKLISGIINYSGLFF